MAATKQSLLETGQGPGLAPGSQVRSYGDTATLPEAQSLGLWTQDGRDTRSPGTTPPFHLRILHQPQWSTGDKTEAGALSAKRRG